MQARKHSAKWWGLVVLHNWGAHFLLPFGEVLDVVPSRRSKRVAQLIFDIHDHTFPDGAG